MIPWVGNRKTGNREISGQDEDWDKTKVHPRLRFPDLPEFLDEFINFVTCGKFNPQEAVGATHPKGFVWEFNRIAKRRGLERRARRIRRGGKSALVGEVQNGNPVTVILVWEDGGAHYVTALSYSHLTNEVFFLDPDDEYKEYPPAERVRSQPWEAFEEDWIRRAWWGKLLGLKQEMVVIS